MLSSYHKQFVRVFLSGDVRFLVIGGQARRLCAGSPGYDLDIWLEFSDRNFDPVLGALLAWAIDHPMHVQPHFFDQLPFELRNGLQVNFPSTTDEVFYVDGDTTASVSSADGINMLIGNKGGPSFAGCLGRAVRANVDDMIVPCLSEADDRQLPRLSIMQSERPA